MLLATEAPQMATQQNYMRFLEKAQVPLPYRFGVISSGVNPVAGTPSCLGIIPEERRGSFTRSKTEYVALGFRKSDIQVCISAESFIKRLQLPAANVLIEIQDGMGRQNIPDPVELFIKGFETGNIRQPGFPQVLGEGIPDRDARDITTGRFPEYQKAFS